MSDINQGLFDDVSIFRRMSTPFHGIRRRLFGVGIFNCCNIGMEYSGLSVVGYGQVYPSFRRSSHTEREARRFPGRRLFSRGRIQNNVTTRANVTPSSDTATVGANSSHCWSVVFVVYSVGMEYQKGCAYDREGRQGSADHKQNDG